MIPLTPLLSSIIHDLTSRSTTSILSEEDKCLSYVLMNRLAQTTPINNFLPMSTHKLLLPIIEQLQAEPTDTTSLSEWAKRVFSTERTLARHFQKELKMSFNEWRQRAKLVKSMTLLKQPISINEIAFQLGYSKAHHLLRCLRS